MNEPLYKYYLDGKLFQDPAGWEKWEETTVRDKEINALFTTIDVSVDFFGKAYDYLYNLKNTVGKDGRAILTVEQYNGSFYTRIYRGTIFVIDVEFNRTIGIAKAKVQDDSYYARINNNKSVPCVISANRSKNGTTIASPTPYMVELRKVSDNTALRSIYTIRLCEVFRVLIDFMSDGEVDFVSDTMTTGSMKGLCITSGIKLFSLDTAVNGSADSNPMPETNFSEAIQEVSRKYPLGMSIERVGDRPLVRIESADYFFQEETVHRFDNVAELKETTDLQKLFAKIRLGSETTNNDTLYPFPESITFFGFKEEEIPVKGIGNIDKELSLNSQWIISSNVIQLLTEDLNNDYDGDHDDAIVLLETIKPFDNVDSGYTLNTNYLNLGPAQYFFNPGLTNDKVAQRWLDSNGIPDSILKFIFPDTLGFLFKAKLSADQTYNASGGDLYDPTGFDQELYDDRGAYNNATFRYTADRGGLYTFKSVARINITAQISAPVIFWRLVLRHYDSNGTEYSDLGRNEWNLYNGNFTGPTGIEYYSNSLINVFNLGGSHELTLNMAAGDYCEIHLSKSLGGVGDINYTIEEENTFFMCTKAVISGEVFEDGDPTKFKASLNHFEDALKPHEYLRLMENQRKKVAVSDAFGNAAIGHIEQMTYNRLTTETKLTIISAQEIL